MVTIRLSGTVIEIFSLEDYQGHDFDLLWSRDIIGDVTIRLPHGVFPIGGQW